MRRLLLLFAILICCIPLMAQTKSETKAYNNAIKKSTVKSFDSFLKKYPDSVYSLEILSLRDSTLFLSVDKEDVIAVEAFANEHKNSPIIDSVNIIIDFLNTSSISDSQAFKIFSEVASDGLISGNYKAVGYRSHGKEYVVGVNLGIDNCTVSLLSQQDGLWKIVESHMIEQNSMLGRVESRMMADNISIVKTGDTRSLYFGYVNYAKGGRKAEYVANLYTFDEGKTYSALFYGNNLLKPSERNHYSIEGQDPSSMSTGLVLPQEIFLKNAITENPLLLPISEGNLKVDNAIEWWYEKNPKAESTAKSITFGLLESDNPLIEQFNKTVRETSSNYRAALFDYRGQTIICAYNTRTKEYILVWCEPQAVDKNRDKLLNSIYFEKESTLCMFYYKGKTTFKIRLNLANKKVTRS